jgi:hypothetical protein
MGECEVNTYDPRDPLTFCSWCQKEHGEIPKPGESSGICGRHATELLAEVQAQCPNMTRQQWEALERFKASPGVKDAISGLQERKRAYKRRQRAFLLQVAIGALTAAVVLAVAVKVMLLLAK